MFNALIHRHTIVLMLVFLYGYSVGRVGHLEPWPAVDHCETANPPQDTVARSVVQPAKAGTDNSGLNNVAEPVMETLERRDKHKVGPSAHSSQPEDAATHTLWQAPIQTADGGIVISLEAAGVPKAEAQTPAENIMGMIVQAN